MVTLRTLHHLALVVIVFIAACADWAEVSCRRGRKRASQRGWGHHLPLAGPVWSQPPFGCCEGCLCYALSWVPTILKTLAEDTASSAWQPQCLTTLLTCCLNKWGKPRFSRSSVETQGSKKRLYNGGIQADSRCPENCVPPLEVLDRLLWETTMNRRKGSVATRGIQSH